MSPGSERPVAVGWKSREDLERQRRLEREVALPADAPAPPALALQQEDVVRIEVRAHAAARRGVAHHQVVEARVRNEREAAQQRVAGGADAD